MRKFATLAALSILLAPRAEDGGSTKTAAEMTGEKVDTGAGDKEADLRIELQNARNHIKALTKENQAQKGEIERLQGIVNAIPASEKVAPKLAKMIAEKRKAGLSQEQAEECARRQLAHDEEQERLAAVAPKEPKAPKEKDADKNPPAK
jgi:hypothetical protein